MINICIRVLCARHMATSSDRKRGVVFVRVFATAMCRIQQGSILPRESCHLTPSAVSTACRVCGGRRLPHSWVVNEFSDAQAGASQVFLNSAPSGTPTRMARCEQRPSLGGRWDRNPGLCATGFPPHTGGIAAKISRIYHVARTHADDVLDLVLTTICQDRYACDVKDVNADFLTMMAALVKSGICSKAR